MFFLWCILPAIAIGVAGYVCVRPLLGLTKMGSYESQTTPCSESQIEALAAERQTIDEYETLIELGFQPLGTNWDQVGPVGNRDDDHSLVLVHVQYPALAMMCVNIDKQKFVKFYSADDRGRVLATSSCENTPSFRDESGWSQVVDAVWTEQVFEAHVRAIDQWEQEGAVLRTIKTPQEVDAIMLSYFRTPVIQKLMRGLFLQQGFGSLVFTAVMPLIAMIIIAVQFAVPNGMHVQLYAVLSIIGAGLWCKMTMWIKPNEKENSIRGGNSNAMIAPTQLKTIETHTDGSSTCFDIPERDNEACQSAGRIGTLATAAIVCFWTLVPGLILFTTGGVIVKQMGANPMQWIAQLPFIVMPLLVWAGGVWQVIPAMGLCWKAWSNRSRQTLELKDGLLVAREQSWLRDFTRTCKAHDIVAIGVEPLEENRFAQGYAHWVSTEGVGCIRLTGPGGKMDVMEFYDVQFLASLAETLRQRIGLATSVHIAPEFNLESKASISAESKQGKKLVEA